MDSSCSVTTHFANMGYLDLLSEPLFFHLNHHCFVRYSLRPLLAFFFPKNGNIYFIVFKALINPSEA
jgi:hypothetical protein